MTAYRPPVAALASALSLAWGSAAYSQAHCPIEDLVSICVTHSGSLDELERWAKEAKLGWERFGSASAGSANVTVKSGAVYHLSFQRYSDLTAIKCYAETSQLFAVDTPGQIVFADKLTACKGRAVAEFLPDFSLIDAEDWVDKETWRDYHVNGHRSIYQLETEDQRVTVSVLEQQRTDDPTDVWYPVLAVDKVIFHRPS